jgi:ATP-binding cassette, subfamily B, bacterial PglK
MHDKFSTKKQTKPSEGLFSLLLQLFRHISKRRQQQFILLLCLMLISSFAEVVSLGAVVPFVGVLTQPEKIFQYPAVTEIADIFGIGPSENLILPLTIMFATAALFSGGIRLALLWVSIRLANATGADLSIDVYRRTLYQSYSIHIARSSSEIISGITQKVGTATSVLISLVTVIISTSLFVAIMSTLLFIEPMGAIFATVIFGSTYGVIAWSTRRRLVQNSYCIAQEQTQVVKSLQEGLGAIRDVLLDGTQMVYCNVYSKAILKLQRASGENSFFNQAPRYGMETLGLVLIAFFILALNHRTGSVTAALPILAVLALGAQRLLPLMQQIYGNWSVVTGSKAGLSDVLDLLNQPLPAQANQPEPEPLLLRQSIRFDNVSFQYSSNGPWVLGGINLTIPRGARIGIIGSTGSGKSTMTDLLLCLLEPTRGQILIDGQSVSQDHQLAWQRTIAHVPQSIFMADATIAENIAFGIPVEKIDFDRVKESAKKAQFADFIESRPAGYDAFVGERGVQLSGGQRQRIGIARALYKNASVLVFDEATSALDNETEHAIMETINGLSKDLTMFIIAHRLTTLKNCTQIIELNAGVVSLVGTYLDLIGGDVVQDKTFDAR